jgi:hypothetical protein
MRFVDFSGLIMISICPASLTFQAHDKYVPCMSMSADIYIQIGMPCRKPHCQVRGNFSALEDLELCMHVPGHMYAQSYIKILPDTSASPPCV